MKLMIPSFEMKGENISDHLLMLWFQKDSLNIVGFRTYDRGSRVLNQKVTFRALKVPGGRGVTGLGLRFYFCHFLGGFPQEGQCDQALSKS